MNDYSVETLSDPVFQKRMPLFNENMASSGLSKPQNMSNFMGKQTLQYRGAFYSYEPRGKDGAAFSPPWSSSKAPAVDGRSPVSHLSGMDGLNHIIYRQDNTSQENHSHCSSQRHSPEKQGFAFYTKSPGISSPQPTAATSVIVRKPKDGGQSVSPLPEKPVYVAIPRPIYGHNPCCSEVCCVMGQRYSMEHGSPTVSNSVYEQTWRHRDLPHTETLSNQQKAPQKFLPMETFSELPRPVAMYSPGRAHTLPAVVDQSYSTTKLKEWFDSLNEQGQCLQPSPRAYPSLYPSHTTYEPVIYQHRSPISKYGQVAQHPMFYYPPSNVEAEKRTECKDMGSKNTEDVPVILKHSIQTPGERYVVAPSLCGDISLPVPRTEALPNPSFLQGYAYPGYTVPQFHLNRSPIHAPLKHPHTVHSKYMNTGPSNQVHHPVASSANMHKDKSSLHTEHSPFLLLEQTSPSTCIPNSAVAPSSIHTQNRYCPLQSCVHLDRPLMAPAHVRSYVKQPHTSPTAWGSPKHSAISNKSNMQKLLYCPPLVAGTINYPSPRPNVPKGPVKRSMSHLSSPIKINDDNEEEDMYVIDTSQKRQKTEKGDTEIQNKNVSPPMPVIDNVFSLAPYLQNPRRFWGRLPQKTLQCVEFSETKRLTEDREPKFPRRFQQQSAIVSNDIQLETPTAKEERPEECKQPSAGASEDIRSDIPKAQVNLKQESPDKVQQMSGVLFKNTKVDTSTVKVAPAKNEPNVIKKEKVFIADQGDRAEDQINVIKKEPEESDSTDCEPMLEIKKLELDDLEKKVLVEEKDNSSELTSVNESAQNNCSSGTEACTLNELLLKAPSKAACAHESKLHFLNIPPQCLKLSTYNIILPDANLPHTVQISAKTPVQPVSQAALPSLELQMPVRKHFFELHQSLVKLISKSVAASSEETLRSWLARMELNNLVSLSAKVQKVTCLFGVKGREACLNEEMKSSMHSVLQRLNEYTSQERCPFPFVIRTGAIFLPMLVVKEVLFPTVQGSLIDQVLQEHKVELRPATLSEEKTLIQLHKRACSSRLRRLMSLKHLPDVYADVVNLLFYTCVCKHLGLEMNEPEEASEGPNSCRSPAMPPLSPHRGQEEPQTKSTLKRKSRVKSSSRRTFLNCSSDEGEGALKCPRTEDVLNSSQKTCNEPQLDENTNKESDWDILNQEASSDSAQIITFGNSWMCPLTSEELSKLPSDAEQEDPETRHNRESSGATLSQDGSKSCSGVILKLRRMFSDGLNRKGMSYQPVLDSYTHSQTEPSGGESSPERSSKLLRTTPEGGFSHALRPRSSCSKRKHRSLLKIKYCPYLSACHSAEHRRRWVLRSAVQRARRAMKIYYPDLVGKRIHHLYEEDDKSEVWYRGEVLRIHKAHPNPLKTIFEVRYDTEPDWKYYLELLIDYKKGWLKIQD